ncbi:ABC transporter permease [Pilimelia columellifera]|uniref:ABC transporter permease n=1 Tax=Pilimelia columellifera subsp. columellifera TaxID=706583 RepID=A0ABP6A9Y0_9ACTN
MNTFQATRLVAAREIRVRLLDRAYLISTAVYLLMVAGLTILPGLVGGPSSVAVVSAEAAPPLRAAGADVRVVGSASEAEKLVRSGDVDAAVVDGRVLAMNEAPTDVVTALSSSPPINLLAPDAVDPGLAFLAPFAIAMLFYMTALGFGMQIAMSVTEEKQTRVVEILVASVPVRALLSGKIIGTGILALAQITLVVAVALVGLSMTDVGVEVWPLIGPALDWFIPFFLFGFAALAALWAAAGALVARVEDVGAASMPLQMIVLAPLVAVLTMRDNAVAMTVLSYFPLSSPTVMPARLFAGDVAAWEPVLSLALLAATAAGFLLAGARVYRGGLLRNGGRVRLAAAWGSSGD